MLSLMFMKHEYEQIWKTFFLPIDIGSLDIGSLDIGSLHIGSLDIGSLDIGLARHWNRLKCLCCGGLRHFS